VQFRVIMPLRILVVYAVLSPPSQYRLNRPDINLSAGFDQNLKAVEALGDLDLHLHRREFVRDRPKEEVGLHWA